jgi:signal transduction histidine kinase
MKISDFIRTHGQEIAKDWEAQVTQRLDSAKKLSRPALIDHIPEFLKGLAAWIDGDTERALRAFDALAEGHALQRLGHGIDLETLTLEYSILRTVVLRHLLDVESSEDVRSDLIRLNEGMDLALHEAVRRYAAHREELRERFIGILGHDLRNPLSAVSVTATQLLKSEGLDPKHVRLAARIARGADRMARMIHDVLDFARGHLGGGIPATPTPNDMGEMCRFTIEELEMAHSGRTIALHLDGDLRGAWDRDRVIQALSNLVANALHYGQDPVSVTARSDGAEAVVTEVHNAGPPIPPHILPTIFEPFRGRGERQPGSGLGLGLYIVRQIAIAHGATCNVSSSDKEGTTFTIRWPRTLPEKDIPRREAG